MSTKQLKLFIAYQRMRGLDSKSFRLAIHTKWLDRLILSPPKEDK